MKNLILSILAVCVSITMMSCGATQEITSFWKNPEMAASQTYKKVFIVVLTSDRGARNVVEKDLAAAATARGLTPVRSIDYFPNIASKVDMPSEAAIQAKIKEMGCDAIFTLSLLDVKSEQRYVPGTTSYVGGGYSPYQNYGYYGGFYGYYSTSYAMVTEPGYYTTDKTYFIEANLYDAATGKINFSIQSNAYNPTNLDDFSKEYTYLLSQRLNEEKPMPVAAPDPEK